MELFIRSQDKRKLEKFNSAALNYASVDMKQEYYVTINGMFHFGKYDTKERAIEVIDEIEQILQTRHCYGTDYVDANMVFEMPQE